jgi:NADH-quinone oxidoreductase subunit C/D
VSAPAPDVLLELGRRLGPALLATQPTEDEIPTAWVATDRLLETLRWLKEEPRFQYRMLFDLTAIDERDRRHRPHQPKSDFSVVYHLLSFEQNADVRLKVPLDGDAPALPTATALWPAANWYEREIWDMFGIRFEGHPHLKRLLMPESWAGYPLRKDHAARATELPPFTLDAQKESAEQEALRFAPEDWGLSRERGGADLLFLNVGPQHPGTHGVLRLVLQLDGEEIVDMVPEIGFHHRGAEKMGERQSWHTFIPYTDRVDYLGGVMNNFPYVMAVERLCGIDVPSRAQLIRILTAELFRIQSHLVWYGTFAQDLGSLSPVFFTFNDRERIFDITSAICGARMHPNWFRIGGVAQDLPQGWDAAVRGFITYFEKRLRELDRMILHNGLFKARTKGVSPLMKADAIEWGITGPMLRAAGLEWDLRKKRHYSGYEQLEFDVPTATHGDCHDRAYVRTQEMRQSLRILEQCVEHMPGGPYKSHHPLATPPERPRMLEDIETLITHFLSVSWGPVVPPGEAIASVEGTKGINGYYLVSDGSTLSYRTRIRTPSFPHMQAVPWMTRGRTVPDLLAVLGSVDFVLADIDR